MDLLTDHIQQTRRGFLTGAASGLGTAAMAALLQQEGLLAADAALEPAGPLPAYPLRQRPPHFAAPARACIFIFLAGGTSQIELFDPKPELSRLDGQTIPESFLKGVRFSFLKPTESLLMGSRFKFRRYGAC